MGRRLLSALAVAAVLGVAAAAVFDSIRGAEPQGATPPPEPPPCREDQLALALVTSDDPPVVVLRHARGPRCIADEYDVVVQVPRGELLVRGGWIDWTHCPSGCAIDTVGGLFAAGIQEERTFRFQPSCDLQGPFSATVRVGPYSARAAIPVLPCLRTSSEIAAFHRDCVRSWNGPGNRANREFVAAERFDHAVLFRSSDATTAERCGLHLVSSASGRWLLAYRIAARWWSIERFRSGSESPEIDSFHDDRPAVVRQDGALALTDD
jgi:hypothetical protein